MLIIKLFQCRVFLIARVDPQADDAHAVLVGRGQIIR